MDETFLTGLFRLTGQRWFPTHAAETGAVPMTGPSDTADFSAGGYWGCELDVATLYEFYNQRQWRALMGRLMGGAIVVPVLDYANPFPASLPDGDKGVTHSDGTTFSDGSRYRTSVISYSLESSAALRATSLVVRRNIGSMVKGGEYFTLNADAMGERLHYITSVTDVSGDVAKIDFMPPLRQVYDAGAIADFEKPRCRMKLQMDSVSSAWPKIVAPFEFSPTISFAETFE